MPAGQLAARAQGRGEDEAVADRVPARRRVDRVLGVLGLDARQRQRPRGRRLLAGGRQRDGGGDRRPDGERGEHGLHGVLPLIVGTGGADGPSDAGPRTSAAQAISPRSHERSCARTSPAGAMARGRAATVRSPSMTLRELTSRHADRLIAAALGSALLRRDRHRVALRRRPGRSASPPPSPSAPRWPGAGARRSSRSALAVVLVELSNLAAPALAEAGTFLVGFIVALYSAGRWARGRTLVAGRGARRRGHPAGGDRAGPSGRRRRHRLLPGLLRRADRRRADLPPPRRARARARRRARDADGPGDRRASARGSRASCTTSSPMRSA